MINWKTIYFVGFNVFGIIFGIVALILAFVAGEPSTTCEKDLILINGIYSIIGPIFAILTTITLLRISPNEMKYIHKFIMGMELKPLPGDVSLYKTIQPGKMTDKQRALHGARLDAIQSRYDEAVLLTTIPIWAIVIYILIELSSVAWSIISLLWASRSVCIGLSALRVWSFLAPPLIIVHALFQIVNVLKIRSASMNFDDTIGAFRRAAARHERFLDTDGTTWSESDGDYSSYSSNSDSYSSDTEDSYNYRRRNRRLDKKSKRSGSSSDDESYRKKRRNRNRHDDLNSQSDSRRGQAKFKPKIKSQLKSTTTSDKNPYLPSQTTNKHHDGEAPMALPNIPPAAIINYQVPEITPLDPDMLRRIYERSARYQGMTYGDGHIPTLIDPKNPPPPLAPFPIQEHIDEDDGDEDHEEDDIASQPIEVTEESILDHSDLSLTDEPGELFRELTPPHEPRQRPDNTQTRLRSGSD
jgi:hypothetical protein